MTAIEPAALSASFASPTPVPMGLARTRPDGPATRVARLSILDSYGVRWTHETFARDLLQNFFDSTADFRAIVIDVREEEGTVEIRGPETFDLDLLAYIGATTKNSGRTAGGFGEGFKICALIGARDFGLTITAGSGPQEIAVFFDPVPLGRELCYRITTRAPEDGRERAGSFVRLEGCDAACLAAFRVAPRMFRHPDNPRLQDPLVVDEAQGVAVYAVAEGDEAELYYRRQLRGRARFYGSTSRGRVTLAHDGVVEVLEGDRDRRDLPTQPVAQAVGDKLAPEAMHRVLLHLMPFWKFGNEVLAGLLHAATVRKLRFAWPARWLARSSRADLVQFAERQGYDIALAAFAELGMATPEQHYTGLETRPASPIERGRFLVVRDLYGELAGQPAKTTALEVFDTEGAAVAGQHLGNKIIVGAQLFEQGFDAVSGTILHELAHETGGEEDVRFLRRLTLLLGEALRAPEKVRAARRRYAVAEPVEVELEANGATIPAYTPEHDHGGEDVNGVVVTVIGPPAFPPMEAFMATLRKAAKDAGIGIWVCPVTVSGPVGAVTWRAPGLPTLLVGGADVEPPPEGQAAFGYRLRTYGPDRRGLHPDPESIQAALRRALELGQTGKAGINAHSGICDGHRERVQEMLGITLPRPPTPKKRTKRDERDSQVRGWLYGHIQDQKGYGLTSMWSKGRASAMESWLLRARSDRRPAAPLYFDISARLKDLVAFVFALRDADTDYDDADAFERHAMDAALGAACSAFGLHEERAAAEESARAAFGAVREATARVLDLDVALDAKAPILEHTLFTSGVGYPFSGQGGFDLAVFRSQLELSVAEAVRMQRAIDEDGGHMIEGAVSTALGKAAPNPRTGDQMGKNLALWEEQRKSSLVLRAVHERTLAATGDPLAAAQRCLEEAARLRPEAPPPQSPRKGRKASSSSSKKVTS